MAIGPQTFRLWPCAGVVLAGVWGGVAMGVALGISTGWAGGDAAKVVQGGVLAGATWTLGAGAGLLGLVAAARGDRANLGMGVLASSMGRMLTALMLSLLVFFTSRPDGTSFFGTFLLAGLCALAGEVAWAVRTLASLRSHSVHSTPAPTAGSGVAR